MNTSQLWLAIGFTALAGLFGGRAPAIAQEKAAQEKAAREVAVAYAKAHNLKTDRAAAVMKVAAVPFFPGVVSAGGSGPSIPVQAQVFKTDDELRKWLAGNTKNDQLSLEVRRVESYADFRRTYLVKEPAAEGPGDLRPRLWQAAREALDLSVGKDGLIVFLGGEPGFGEGVLVRFDKGTAKVAGVLGNTNPELRFSVLRPAPEKGK